MKKFLSFLLLSAILCSFAACGGNQPTQTTPAAEGTTAAPSSSESATVPEETPVFPENASYDGHDFLILVAGNYKSNDFASDENNADIIGSAIYRRNMIINEKFDVNKLKSQILYWSQNMESVRTDCNKYESVIKVVDIQTPLFELRKDIRVEELQQFFMNVFQPILVEKKTTRQTGINFFDSNVNVAPVNTDEVNALKQEKSNLLQQINNLKSIIGNKDMEIDRLNSNKIVNGDLKVNNEEPIYDFGMNRTDIIRRINLFEDDE